MNLYMKMYIGHLQYIGVPSVDQNIRKQIRYTAVKLS